eukprot:jgi/Galph1/301/GphlegSOOS_G5084.1
MITTLPQKVVVLYHYPCHDGIFAATCAYLFFRKYSSTVRFIPHKTYEKLNVSLDDAEVVYFLDYAGETGVVENTASKVRTVLIDHHKTAISYFQSNPSKFQNLKLELVLEYERSGCGLAWEYFSSLSEKVFQVNLIEDPLLAEEFFNVLKAIQDGDLWLWKEATSKYIVTGLSSTNHEYDYTRNPMIFSQLLNLRVEDLLAVGKASIQGTSAVIKREVEKSFFISPFPTTKFLAVEVDSNVAKIRSELGNNLATLSAELSLAPVGAIIYRESDWEVNSANVKVSLRSLGDFDTTVISEHFGGGGHRNASAFVIAKEQVDRWKIP